MKKLLMVIVFVISASFVFGQSSRSPMDTNGNDWNNMTVNEQVTFVMGFFIAQDINSAFATYLTNNKALTKGQQQYLYDFNGFDITISIIQVVHNITVIYQSGKVPLSYPLWEATLFAIGVQIPHVSKPLSPNSIQ